jgi:hypothetical protein
VIVVLVTSTNPNKKELLLLIKKKLADASFFYLRRKIEITAPNKPTTPIPIITRPDGTPPVPEEVSSGINVGKINGGGAVNVGKRVGGISTINWAARVGSTVGVVRGVGVGGGSITCNEPDTSTRGLYTHANPDGPPT